MATTGTDRQEIEARYEKTNEKENWSTYSVPKKFIDERPRRQAEDHRQI